MEKINGIIYDGKIYESVKGKCENCDLDYYCNLFTVANSVSPCVAFGDETKIFRFSPKLTDRLNEKIK